MNCRNACVQALSDWHNDIDDRLFHHCTCRRMKVLQQLWVIKSMNVLEQLGKFARSYATRGGLCGPSASACFLTLHLQQCRSCRCDAIQSSGGSVNKAPIPSACSESCMQIFKSPCFLPGTAGLAMSLSSPKRDSSLSARHAASRQELRSACTSLTCRSSRSSASLLSSLTTLN